MPSNQFRIIAGEWRGRKLRFPDAAQLRPTPDRVRETLFNWLMPVIQGARCLDLFAGSGALAFEALSRGAASVTLVEKAGPVVRELRASLSLLDAEQRAEVVQADARDFLRGTPRAYDVVFLDPPYNTSLLDECLPLLISHSWVHEQTYIYLEHARQQTMPGLPAGWCSSRDKSAGDVAYHLLQRLDADQAI